MENAKLIKTLHGLFAPVLTGMGLDLWGIDTTGGDGMLVVRIFVEREGGVDVDACAEASRHLSLLLDVEDPIPGRYALEVSSPGLERHFFSPRQMEAYIGRTIEAKLSDSTPEAPNRRNYKGELLAVEGDNLRLRVDNAEYVVPWSLVTRCRLRITDWDAVKKGQKP